MVSGCACAASQNIFLKRRERDAELVGRMVEGGLCPQRAAGSKSQDCSRGGGGEDPRWGRKLAAVYSFSDSFLSSVCLLIFFFINKKHRPLTFFKFENNLKNV